MTSLRCSDFILKVSISKEEKITINKTKSLIGKARRMIKQNRLTSVILDVDNKACINKSALIYFNRVLCYSNSFPVIIIRS